MQEQVEIFTRECKILQVDNDSLYKTTDLLKKESQIRYDENQSHAAEIVRLKEAIKKKGISKIQIEEVSRLKEEIIRLNQEVSRLKAELNTVYQENIDLIRRLKNGIDELRNRVEISDEKVTKLKQYAEFVENNFINLGGNQKILKRPLDFSEPLCKMSKEY